MAKAGIPAETLDKGQMVIAPVSETYSKGGDFNVLVMCDTLKAVAGARKTEGYPRARLTGRMEWALESRRRRTGRFSWGPPGIQHHKNYTTWAGGKIWRFSCGDVVYVLSITYAKVAPSPSARRLLL
jgi:hypothetical protein